MPCESVEVRIAIDKQHGGQPHLFHDSGLAFAEGDVPFGLQGSVSLYASMHVTLEPHLVLDVLDFDLSAPGVWDSTLFTLLSALFVVVVVEILHVFLLYEQRQPTVVAAAALPAPTARL